VNFTSISNLLEGFNNITVAAYDWRGNIGTDHVIIMTDTTPPSIVVESPTDNSYVRSIVTVNATVDDARFAFMEFFIDDVLISNFTTAGSKTYQWNTTMLPDGSHVLKLRAEDTLGNVNLTRVDVFVDNTMPEGRIIPNLNMTYTKDAISFSIYAYDANLNRTELFINQDLKQSWVSSGFYDYEWNTTLEQEGSYTIRLVIYDKAGNMFEEVNSVFIDRTKPNVAISSPATSTEVNGVVTINFEATDSNLQNALLYIDNAVFDVTGQTQYLWDSRSVADNLHVIKLVATDKAGNSNETQVIVTTTNIRDTYISQIDQLNDTNQAYASQINQLQNQMHDLEQWISQLEIIVIVIAAAVIAAPLIVYAVMRRKQVKPKT
jgi:hypothetical protein